ncbi:hypothetical protein [Arthrobacter sp. MMS24-S77]
MAQSSPTAGTFSGVPRAPASNEVIATLMTIQQVRQTCDHTELATVVGNYRPLALRAHGVTSNLVLRFKHFIGV